MNQPHPIREVDPGEAARLADAGDALLLDVREDDEWDTGHAPQATHVPLGALDPATVPRDRPVIAVCRSGGRAAKAAQALTQAGHDVRNLTGGMQAWTGAGLPVQAADGTPGTVA